MYVTILPQDAVVRLTTPETDDRIRVDKDFSI